jgi:hypothetical protein
VYYWCQIPSEAACSAGVPVVDTKFGMLWRAKWISTFTALKDCLEGRASRALVCLRRGSPVLLNSSSVILAFSSLCRLPLMIDLLSNRHDVVLHEAACQITICCLVVQRYPSLVWRRSQPLRF